MRYEGLCEKNVLAAFCLEGTPEITFLRKWFFVPFQSFEGEENSVPFIFKTSPELTNYAKKKQIWFSPNLSVSNKKGQLYYKIVRLVLAAAN